MTEPSRLGVLAAILAVTIIGWTTAGYAGATVAIAVALAIFVVPWKGQTALVWALLRLRRQ